MIIGFGFGSPLVSLLMLLITGTLSYLIYRATRRFSHPERRMTRAELRQYYYEQRRRAREFAERFDLTDEEIERKIDEELGPPDES
ncbi:DUF2236 domain-containing protein [Alicyclobacillus cycloheptanicus]|uniref:Uncharacterized protein n=1 Tax=Alicyclobacillus cycloheptanicus TaxID=1457 RepID=A0ABT9XIS3_9BACL|nr:hypothetical protein [Alicyclobacillus cycloheptanicus]MDQ0190208.1 hypothetical protein [Alicyclobacillus cycloheptanicus]WDM02544.1 DUF2236 domain-containing protein [Alicyclobacillus cycloheptanicus]